MARNALTLWDIMSKIIVTVTALLQSLVTVEFSKCTCPPQ